jgi:hypothetical protein
MPFALFIVGLFLLITGVKNTQGSLYKLLIADFTGSNNFIYWIVTILIVGAVGYIPALKGISRAFLLLILVVLFLTKGNPSGIGGGFFAKFQQALNLTQSVPPSGIQSLAPQGGSSAPSGIGSPSGQVI